MNELHGIGFHDIASLFNDEFQEEWTWACLSIVDETCELSPWCWINF
jgi:hypothetical protein